LDDRNLRMTNHIVGPTSRPVPPSGAEPDDGRKKFCTFWIRNGECDYTQQGCLYRHEMPDQITLAAIGFREIPKWWREKLRIEEKRREREAMASGDWRAAREVAERNMLAPVDGRPLNTGHGSGSSPSGPTKLGKPTLLVSHKGGQQGKYKTPKARNNKQVDDDMRSVTSEALIDLGPPLVPERNHTRDSSLSDGLGKAAACNANNVVLPSPVFQHKQRFTTKPKALPSPATEAANSLSRTATPKNAGSHASSSVSSDEGNDNTPTNNGAGSDSKRKRNPARRKQRNSNSNNNSNNNNGGKKGAEKKSTEAKVASTKVFEAKAEENKVLVVEVKKESAPTTPIKSNGDQKKSEAATASTLPTPAPSPTVTVVVKTESAVSESTSSKFSSSDSVGTPGSNVQLSVSRVSSVE